MVEYWQGPEGCEEAEGRAEGCEEAQRKAEEAHWRQPRAMRCWAGPDRHHRLQCQAEKKLWKPSGRSPGSHPGRRNPGEVAALLAEAQEAMERPYELVCASDLFRMWQKIPGTMRAWDYAVAPELYGRYGRRPLWRERDHDPRPDGDDSVPDCRRKPSVEGLENPLRDVAGAGTTPMP